ncbi:MAG: response regulator [Spirochaetia bacterium]
MEDNRDVLEIIRSELSRGFNIIPKRSGEDGLAYLKENPAPAVIISDIMMPGMDGRDFFYRVRDGLKLSNVPFLFLTARASFDEMLEFLKEGAADYICIPFSPELLQQRREDSVKKRLTSQIRQLIEQDDVSEIRSGNPTIPEIQMRYSLTDRETEVLSLMLTGLRDKEIARKLGCAVSTVSNTASRIYKKSDCGSRVELLRKISG